MQDHRTAGPQDCIQDHRTRLVNIGVWYTINNLTYKRVKHKQQEKNGQRRIVPNGIECKRPPVVGNPSPGQKREANRGCRGVEMQSKSACVSEAILTHSRNQGPFFFSIVIQLHSSPDGSGTEAKASIYFINHSNIPHVAP